MKFKDIAKIVDPKDEVFFYDPETGIAAVLDLTSHLKHLYKTKNGSDFEEVSVDYKGMAARLAQGLDVKQFLEEVLTTTSPAEVLEIKERLEHPEASVVSKPRCFSLMIGGKVGQPMELTLRR